MRRIMKTSRVAINNLDGVSLYYAIASSQRSISESGIEDIVCYEPQYGTFEDVEYLLKECVGHIEYDTTFQEYIVTSRIDENIFAVSALLPEAIAMCAVRVIYKDRSHVDIPVCIMDNW